LRKISVGLRLDVLNYYATVSLCKIKIKDFLAVELELSNTIAAIFFFIEDSVRLVVRIVKWI
jgi:hypothetical protein